MPKSTLDYLDSLVLLLLEPGQDMRLKAFLDQRKIKIPLKEFKNQTPEEQEKQLEAIIREHKEKA